MDQHRRQSLLVVDNDVRMRDITAHALRELDIVVRYAPNADSAMAAARFNAPAVVMTAVDLGGLTAGIGFARTMKRRHDCALVLTGTQLAERSDAAIAPLDAAAFLCKPIRPEQLQATMRLILQRITAQRSRITVPDARTAELARALRQVAAIVDGTGIRDVQSVAPSVSDTALASLRPREQEVVRLLFEHVRVPGIAHRLGISPQTVRNHLKHIFQSLGVHSQQELIGRLRREPDVPTALVERNSETVDLPQTWALPNGTEALAEGGREVEPAAKSALL